MSLRRLAALTRPFRLLAIESSADDSCAAIVSSDRKIWSNVVVKQHLIHEKFGGIHPIKSQDAHARNIPLAIQTALQEAKLNPEDIDAYAFTQGPGMYGCLSCGSHAANAMAGMMGKPIVGVHHMQAHALTPLLTEPTPPEFPFLNLLVSGGHTLLVLATGETKFKILAKSLDDSIGDAFDKTAKLLDIPWLPGLGPGPSLEHYASSSPDPQLNTATEDLLRKMPRFKPAVRGQFAFSFAGMKTQVMKETAKHWPNLKMKGMP
ncbi:Mitochondrial tRNAs modification protein, partial [Naganishia albida]